MDKMLLHSLISYFEALKIPISKEELELQLYSNPYGSTLFAISNTLDFLRIENVAAKIDKGRMDDLPDHFLAYVEEGENSSYFSHVVQKREKVLLGAEQRELSISEFKKIWNGVVLVAENNRSQVAGMQDRLKWSWGLAVILTVWALWPNPMELAFAFIGLIGLYVSSQIFQMSNDRESALGEKICGQKMGEGCDKVLKSEDYNLFGFSPNDLLFAFLCSQVFFVVVQQGFSSFQPYIYSLALLVLIGSVMAQAFILKSWCRLCLLSAGLVLLQTGSLFFQFASDRVLYPELNTKLILDLGGYSIFFFLFSLLIHHFREVKKQNFTSNTNAIELLKFKRSPFIVKPVLEQSERLKFPEGGDKLQFGNLGSRYIITLILSTTCGFCKNAFLKLSEHYQRNKNSIGYQLIFNHYDTSKSPNNDVAVKLITQLRQNGEEQFLEKTVKWFKTQNRDKFLKSEPIHTNESEYKTLREQREWCERNGIFQTPMLIINGIIVPYYYEPDFLDDVLNVVMENEMDAKVPAI